MLLFSLYNIAMCHKTRSYCVDHIFLRITVFKVQYVWPNTEKMCKVQHLSKLPEIIAFRDEVKKPTFLGVHSHIIGYVRSEVTQVIHVVDIYDMNFSSPTLQAVLWGFYIFRGFYFSLLFFILRFFGFLGFF